MIKDIQSGELFGAGVSQRHVPMHKHGTKVYPARIRNRKNYNVFLDAVWRPSLHMGSCLPCEKCLDRRAQ